MNRSFRLVWSAVLGLWVVASEAAKGKSKSTSKVAGGAKSPLLNLARVTLLAGMGAVALPAQAETTFNWLGGDGNWDDATKWDNGVPTDVPDDEFYVDIRSGIVTLNKGVKDERWEVGIFAHDVSDSAVLRVSGAGTFLGSSVGLYVGYWNGNGALLISDGAKVSSGTARIGAVQGTSVVSVSGAGSSFTPSMILLANEAGGTAELSVTDGATASVDTIISIGQALGSKGVVTVSGVGSTLAAQSIYIGNAGAGVLNIGSAEGEAATAAGKVSGAITLGVGGSGTLVLNHTDTNYVLASDITTKATSGHANISLVNGTTRRSFCRNMTA